MGSIKTADAKGLVTKMLIDSYKENVKVESFLRSFFEVKESLSKTISIEVRRGTEKIAVDVERGTNGNRNTVGKSSEKIFLPPYYKEWFDATELDLYDIMFGSETIDSANFTRFIEEVSEKLMLLKEKIERAYERQCAQVFETGIVTLERGINIDFKRKAASLVDKGGGNYWATGTVNPFDDLENGCKFIREKGKSQGTVINGIFGSTALKHFLANTIVKDRADIRNFSLDQVRAPQKNSVGASLHGQVAAGSYQVNIWTYPEVYDNAAGESTPYINPKKVILIPEVPRFKLAFAAVPQLMKPGKPVKKGAFLFDDYLDEEDDKHIYRVKSAGVAIPVAVDQIYTVQVVAN
jgi:hypothetical protein